MAAAILFILRETGETGDEGRKDKGPFLTGQKWAKKPPRRRKLHIPRFRLTVKAHSLRCSSSPNQTRFVGLRMGPQKGCRFRTVPQGRPQSAHCPPPDPGDLRGPLEEALGKCSWHIFQSSLRDFIHINPAVEHSETSSFQIPDRVSSRFFAGHNLVSIQRELVIQLIRVDLQRHRHRHRHSSFAGSRTSRSAFALFVCWPYYRIWPMKQRVGFYAAFHHIQIVNM